MTPFLLYQLKAGICLMAFTGIYYILFRKETFYHFNRIYLAGTLMVSMVLPLISIRINLAGKTDILPYMIKAVTISTKAMDQKSVDPVFHVNIMLMVYAAVTAVLCTRLLLQLYRVVTVIKSDNTQSNGKFTIITLNDRFQSYSFFNYVFVTKTDLSSDNEILLHEMVHARQYHSIDILLVQCIKIFQWFNPFIYLCEKAMQETHEYLADASVMELNGGSERYKQLLFSQAFGIRPGIISLFNYSMIKNRLAMMIKEKSPYRNRYKYLIAIPIIILMGFVMCCKNSSKEIAPPPPPPPPPPVQTNAGSDSAFVSVDEQAAFDGGTLEKFRDWVQKKLVYPDEAVKKGIIGKVILQFDVSAMGNVKNVKVLRSVDPLLDNEAMRVIMSSPAWKPAYYEGKPVTQRFVIPLIFQLQ